jgi:hypothetical protein
MAHTGLDPLALMETLAVIERPHAAIAKRIAPVAANYISLGLTHLAEPSYMA